MHLTEWYDLTDEKAGDVLKEAKQLASLQDGVPSQNSKSHSEALHQNLPSVINSIFYLKCSPPFDAAASEEPSVTCHAETQDEVTVRHIGNNSQFSFSSGRSVTPTLNHLHSLSLSVESAYSSLEETLRRKTKKASPDKKGCDNKL